MSKSTFHLIDASPYLFRAYFSLPDSMRDPEGRPNAAVFGFASFLVRYLNEERPTHVLAAFDRSLTTSFRNEIYPAYKAQRELPPPELEAQQRRCEEAASELGIATVAHERYEADDLIGAGCRHARDAGQDVVIVSPDKDLSQLVGRNVQLHDVARGERLDVQGVREKFGVSPTQMVDYLALAGDAVDNIPGVRGIGGVTAARLLQAFDDLDAIYVDLERVAELPLRGARGIARKLEESRAMAYLSRNLARIRDEIEDCELDLEAWAWRGAPSGAAHEAARERLGIASLAKRLTLPPP